ncbi:hypothetical protein ACFYP4_22330 [Streptomyces sp. NPDC005551]|uniref:hypothetical protein n=1 Tax=Streptomyces sp. NPDC005551 TaxID=3364725 RepID=UPI0036A7EB7C
MAGPKRRHGREVGIVEGLGHRPDTTYGTVHQDVLEEFVPGFRRTTMIGRIMGAPWPT